VKPNAAPVQKWLATDGAPFDSKREAEIHNLHLEKISPQGIGEYAVVLGFLVADDLRSNVMERLRVALRVAISAILATFIISKLLENRLVFGFDSHPAYYGIGDHRRDVGSA
jgi:hypothetical protein